jgi:hypothetical protein
MEREDGWYWVLIQNSGNGCWVICEYDTGDWYICGRSILMNGYILQIDEEQIINPNE